MPLSTQAHPSVIEPTLPWSGLGTEGVPPPELPPPSNDGFFHPTTEEEIVTLVRAARARGLGVRVRGSAHSVSAAISTDAFQAGRRGEAVDIALDRFAWVRIDEARKQVTVAGGCRLARDPRDPTGRSTDRNGLLYQLDRAGLALSNLGGVTHQTVAGFLATGSAGGSRKHDLHAAVVRMRIVDGTGRVHEVSKEEGSEIFSSAGVSMGLCGVVSSVTFQCEDRYDIVGEEAITTLEDCEIDLFGDGEHSLARFLAREEYARILWWPQAGVEKIAVWKARRMADADYGWETGRRGALVRRPHRAFDPIAGTTLPAQALAGTALSLMPRLPTWIRPLLYNAFVPADRSGPQRFWDSWWQGLPLDNPMDERLLPTSFTEIWIPASRASEAMRRLRDHYARGGAAATGTFTLEIYAAPAGKFWLSPAPGEDAVRFNFFWFDRNPGQPENDYYPQFWQLLADLDARLHWGKSMPPDGSFAARWPALYPKLADFLRVREELDPDQLFVTEYWRRHLDIPRLPGRVAADLPPAPPTPTPAASERPLWFTLEPVEPSFAAEAPHTVEHGVTIEASPEEVYDALLNAAEAPRWFPKLVSMRWLDEERGPGAIVDTTISSTTIRRQVLEAERGRRFVASVDACTLPIAARMLESIEIAPAEDRSTRLTWRLGYALRPEAERLHLLLRPLVAKTLRDAGRGLTAYFEARAWRRPAG